jgi:hypothetical protein
MLIHEWLFSRPFNSSNQRKIAVGGAIWAVLTILFIAACTVFANLAGLFSPEYEPYYLATMVTVIVSNIVIHGILAGIFYYIDDGHKAKNKAARATARAITQNEIDDAAEMILTNALRRRINRKRMATRFISQSAVNAAIREAGGDEDEDGIPDNVDPIDNRTGKPFVRRQNAPRATFQQKPMQVMAKDAEQAKLTRDEDFTKGQGES